MKNNLLGGKTKEKTFKFKTNSKRDQTLPEPKPEEISKRESTPSTTQVQARHPPRKGKRSISARNSGQPIDSRANQGENGTKSEGTEVRKGEQEEGGSGSKAGKEIRTKCRLAKES